MNKCLWCKKKTKNPKYCSLSCSGHNSGKVAQIICKREGKGFFNPEIRKRARETQKKLKKGFYNSKVQSRLGKIGGHNSQKTLKRLKKGLYNLEVKNIGRKVSQQTCKKLGIGIWNFKAQSAGGKIGGLIAVKIQRENKPYYFHKVPFDSNSEKEMGMNLSYQFKIKLKEGVNCHIRIGGKEFDFLIGNCFIEFHPWDRKYSIKEYYKERRKILDKNGYKNFNLIVIN